MSWEFGAKGNGEKMEESGRMAEDDCFDFEKLIVYQKALIFIALVYSAVECFPVIERFALADQFRRAATSIALNIAEGTGGSAPEFRRFLRISRRSIRECVAIMTIARDKSYLDHSKYNGLRKKTVELSRMTSGLINSLS